MSKTTAVIAVQLTRLEMEAVSASYTTAFHWDTADPKEDQLLRARRRAYTKFERAVQCTECP